MSYIIASISSPKSRSQYSLSYAKSGKFLSIQAIVSFCIKLLFWESNVLESKLKPPASVPPSIYVSNT